jgi:hypothetical protein
MTQPQRGADRANGESIRQSKIFNSIADIYTHLWHRIMQLPGLIQKRKRIPNGISLRFSVPSGIQRPVVATVVLTLAILYVLLLILSDHELRNSEENHPSALLRKQIDLPLPMDPHTFVRYIQSQVQSQVVIPDTDLYISFQANIGGQGTGNLISGLLAAQLLGLEFHRIVCVNPMYTNFLSVFEYVHPEVEAKCAAAHEKYSDAMIQNTISLINFVGAADECELQNVMSNTNIPMVLLIANTYPRWPSVPANFFFHHYQPKTVLLEALPYKVHPKTVVHLRQPDDENGDRRSGLDEDSLTALGKALPKDSSTFLVTNDVILYERFEKCCNWDHPQWDLIVHSAFEKIWSVRNGTEASRKYNQNIRMWVDWYTILTAKTVYHTHSDFSISAIHWVNNMDSHSIVGYHRNSGLFETTDESWRRDGETIPMSERTLQGSPGTTNELRACQERTRHETEEREAMAAQKASSRVT